MGRTFPGPCRLTQCMNSSDDLVGQKYTLNSLSKTAIRNSCTCQYNRQLFIGTHWGFHQNYFMTKQSVTSSLTSVRVCICRTISIVSAYQLVNKLCQHGEVFLFSEITCDVTLNNCIPKFVIYRSILSCPMVVGFLTFQYSMCGIVRMY